MENLSDVFLVIIHICEDHKIRKICFLFNEIARTSL